MCMENPEKPIKQKQLKKIIKKKNLSLDNNFNIMLNLYCVLNKHVSKLTK